MEEKPRTLIFAIRTTAGQEKNVADLIATRAKTSNIDLKSVVAPETLRGYVFVEATSPHYVEEAISGVKHVRSRVPGLVDFADVEKYLVSRSVIDEINTDDLVEIIGGPFKGMRARITRVDKLKKEVTLELLEATFTLPITVHVDYVKITEKTRKEKAEES